MQLDPRYPMSLAHRTAGELLEQPDAVLAELANDFALWGMPHQFVPAHASSVVLWFGGRGAAKTTAQANAMLDAVEAGARRLAIIGRTADDIRIFIEGPSGLQAWSRADRMPRYIVSKRKVVWPNGAEALCISIESGVEQAFKGKGFEVGCLLEISTYGDDLEEAWKQTRINARIGRPRIFADANPLPDNAFLRLLVDEADERGITVIPCSSYDNWNNLPDETRAYLDELGRTSLGRAEVFPEFLTHEGALWKPEWIRIQPAPDIGHETVVAVDPAGTSHGDEHGIVCARSSSRLIADAQGTEHRRTVAHVLEDVSFGGPVTEWPRIVAEVAKRYRATKVVIERNRGLDYLRAALRPHLPHIQIEEITVTRSKDDRAIPVAQLYELGRVFHNHRMEILEGQMTTWSPASQGTARRRKQATSPDRLDALVHAIASLNLDRSAPDMSVLRVPRRR